MSRPLLALLPVALLVLAGCAAPTTSDGDEAPAGDDGGDGTESEPAPPGTALSPASLRAFAGAFDDEPFQGGQVAPRLSKWMNDDVFVFMQFDKFPVENATQVRYVGLGVRGTFCEETQPDAENGSFTHFHRWNVADYSQGHGGEPGAEGYWLTWIALYEFTAQDREVKPGVDYEFSPTPPPLCGDAPEPTFEAPESDAPAADELGTFASMFDDEPFQGGQVAPRLSKWVNEDAFLFLQFDKFPVANATAVRYVGLGVRSEFCEQARASADFTHFHRWDVESYGEGHGGPAGSTGYWLLWAAVTSFEAQGRLVSPGVDRAFSPTPSPSCA